MNRKYFLSRIFSNRRLLSIVLVFMVIFIGPFTQSVMANPIEPFDVCIRIDHPPFVEDYGGEGYSYLKLGLTLLLEEYDEGSEFTGELTGIGRTVTSKNRLNASGQVFLMFPLYGYGAYAVVVYDSNGVVVFKDDVTVDEKEVACDAGSLAISPPKTVMTESTEITKETVVQTEEITETGVTGVQETTDVTRVQDTTDVTTQTDNKVSEETPWWPLLMIAGGVFSVLVGIFMVSKRNCDKKRKAWLSASEHARVAIDKARVAQAVAETLSDEKEQLAEELSDIQRTYPSAGKPGGEEAWVEMDGRKISGRDVAMGREEERAAWNAYRSDPNPESASRLEADWKATATPASEEERRELDKEAKALNEAIKATQKLEDEALEQAKNAKVAEERAVREAEEARRAYEACIKKALGPPEQQSGTPTGTTDGSPGGGPKVATGTNADQTPCCKASDPPQERNRQSLGSISIPVKLEVTLEGGGAHEAAVVANDISGQLADASEKLGWISKLMDVKGIGEALVHDGVGWSLLGAAAPPAVGMALDMPVPTSPGQLVVDTLSILGKISSVIIGKVPELQERRLPDCDIQATIVNNVFSAECVEIWVCSNGQWVKDRSRFTLTLISKSSGRMTKRTALTWAQAQQEISRYELLYKSRISSAFDRLAEVESRCR